LLIVDKASIRAIVHGEVQRVYFRASTKEQATALGLTGYAHNLPGGRGVEEEAEGDKSNL